MEIWRASSSDADPIVAIYNHYVRTSVVTFEEEEVSCAEMAARIEKGRSLALPWYVAIDDGKTVGYAYATHWRVRSAYRYSVEVTVYVAPDYSGRGIGSALYRELIAALRGLVSTRHSPGSHCQMQPALHSMSA
jgi:L-amino acid N-acyltransferase YncA